VNISSIIKMQQVKLIFSFLVLVLSIGTTTAATICPLDCLDYFCPYIECVYPLQYYLYDGGCCGCATCVTYALFGQPCQQAILGLSNPTANLCADGLICVNGKCEYNLEALFGILDTVG
jgi:hypothetical protein